LGYKESSRRVSDDMGRPLHFSSQIPLSGGFNHVLLSSSDDDEDGDDAFS